MAKEKFPVTAAIRALREGKILFTEHLYPYEEKGGTATSSRELGVDEHCIIKTLIMEDDKKEPLIILMHGDCQVSTKELARQIGARSVVPSSPEAASRHTGYLVGGTSPFGTKRPLPVYIESSILDLDKIYINGGKRGFLVDLAPPDLVKLLKPTPVRVAING
jgi:Cys-tRNA(Pro) deacylase